MAVPLGAWVWVALGQVGPVLAGGLVALALACGVFIGSILPAEQGWFRKLVVIGPALSSVALAVLALGQGATGGIGLAALGLGYSWIVSTGMQICAWHTGYRGERPNWIVMSFRIQVQDPGRPYRDPLPASIVIGAALVAAVGPLNPLAAAVGLGVFLACSAVASIAAGGSSLLAERAPESSMSLGNIIGYSSMFAGAIGIVAAAIGSVLAIQGKPLLAGWIGTPSFALAAPGLGSGSPLPTRPDSAVPSWLPIALIVIVLAALARTASFWMPWVRTITAWLLLPLRRLIDALMISNQRFRNATERRRIAQLASEIESPFERLPATAQQLLDGTEYLLACAGADVRLRDGLRAAFRAGVHAGLPPADLKFLFQHLERSAYLSAEDPSTEVSACFVRLASGVQSKVGKDIFLRRENDYRIKLAQEKSLSGSAPNPSPPLRLA